MILSPTVSAYAYEKCRGLGKALYGKCHYGNCTVVQSQQFALLAFFVFRQVYLESKIFKLSRKIYCDLDNFLHIEFFCKIKMLFNSSFAFQGVLLSFSRHCDDI